MRKIITFGIPCYNSSAYMDRCVTSILEGAAYAEDVQVVIVDDGSDKDDTLEKARDWERRYPTLVKAVHQENGGHGIAVRTAVQNADGIYFKNVDSDDWVDGVALNALLGKLRKFVSEETDVDLVITNYVYEHVEDNTRNAVNYRHCLPRKKVFGWDDIGHFKVSQYLLMHTLCYKTSILVEDGLDLPPHTFYVDNLYAYTPLPLCHNLYYLDVNLYRYFIGREDQSVNEQVLASRIDHYWRVARLMYGAYHVYEDISSRKLRYYLLSYLGVVFMICTIFSKISDRPDAAEQMKQLWRDFKAYDPHMYRHVRHGIKGTATNLPGSLGDKVTLKGYKLVRKFFKFN